MGRKEKAKGKRRARRRRAKARARVRTKVKMRVKMSQRVWFQTQTTMEKNALSSQVSNVPSKKKVEQPARKSVQKHAQMTLNALRTQPCLENGVLVARRSSQKLTKVPQLSRSPQLMVMTKVMMKGMAKVVRKERVK